MSEGGWDINDEYEKLFGASKHINLFDTYEEYKQLRQLIMSSPVENSHFSGLPFENIELLPYNEYVWKNEIGEAINQKKHIFYIKQKSPYCRVACYYDSYRASFVFLKYSYFVSNDSFDFNDFSLLLDRRRLLEKKSHQDSKGLYITENIRCTSLSETASFVLGRKASLTEWRDEKSKNIVTYYPELARLHAIELKKIEEEYNKKKKGYIILGLLNGVKEYIKKYGTHYFYIKENGKCDASGYYNEENKYFYICKGSLVSYETDLFYIVADKEKARQNFLNKICKEVGGCYQVIRDAKCRSAAAAASYVLGYQEDFTRWKDAEGKTLSEIYPDIYFPLSSKKEKNLKEEKISKIEQIPQEEVKNTIIGRPPRYYYIIRENMGNRSCNAKGMYDKVNKQFVIAEGSVLSYDVTPTYRFTASDIKRKKFIQLNCGNSRTVFKLKRDAICSSPDEAACFVLGENANGWIEWKSKSGLSLESYINRVK